MPTPKQKQRRSLASIVAVLFVGVPVCLCLGKAQGRKEFVGKVDPVTGYRCRFLIGSNWQEERDTFTAPLSAYQRLTNIVFHRAEGDPPEIWLYQWSAEEPNPRFHMLKGYPEENVDSPAWIVEQRHVRIKGQPATVGESEILTAGPASRATFLLVYVPAARTVYELGGFSLGSPLAYQEIQGILSSFHVEKVTSGKR